jgi:ParB family transcriptional regulator, chromosome partitioning protein
MDIRDGARQETGSQLQLFEEKTPLLPDASAKRSAQRESRYQRGRTYLVPLEEITPNPDQPRRHFDEADISSLADSIRTVGLLQPVLCRAQETGLLLAAGERRLRAAGLAGLKRIPVRIVTGDPLETALIENLQRSDLTAVEEAEAIGALKERKGYRLQDLSAVTGKAVPTLSEILSVTRLPMEIRDACRCNPSVPRDVLVLIARLPGQDEMIMAFEQYRAGTVTREGLGERSRKAGGPGANKPVPLTCVRSFTQRFTRFDIGALDRGDRETLRDELEKLMVSIAQTIENLK